MKKTAVFILILSLLMSCYKTSQPTSQTNCSKHVVLLKVDYLSRVFEGGKELAFVMETLPNGVGL